MISEELARTYFANENPVGRSITLPEEKRDLEIAGVSANNLRARDQLSSAEAS